MSKTIEGIPEFLTREHYLGLLAAVGLDPHRISEIRYASDGVHALVFELDEQGRKKYHPGKPGGAHKHRVFIPIRDEGDERTTRIAPVKN